MNNPCIDRIQLITSNIVSKWLNNGALSVDLEMRIVNDGTIVWEVEMWSVFYNLLISIWNYFNPEYKNIAIGLLKEN